MKLMQDISDEDAIKVAELFNGMYNWEIVEKDDFLVLVQCEDYKVFIWKEENDFIDFEERYNGKENIEAHGCESEACSPYRTIIDIVDYLRSKGYHLPNKFEKKVYSGCDDVAKYYKEE